MTEITEQLRDLILGLGVDEVVFADLERVQPYLEQEYGEAWQRYPRAVSLAVHFPRPIVDELLKGPCHTYLAYYDIINAKINEACLQTANYLDKQGYRAYPIPASQRIGDKLAGIFSHRLAAYLGGLGWIGKSGNLVTKNNGPCLRLGTILTDAPLLCGEPTENRCGDCTLCREACPAGAIPDKLWQEGEALCRQIDALACHNYLMEVRHSFGKRICGRCLAACPYGRK